MVDKQQLRNFRQALVQNEEVLAPDDARYVENLHGSNEEDVINLLCDDILTSGSELFYFTGQRGTGKSTELRRLETMLNDEDVQTIRFDSLDYISDTDPVSAETLLLLVTAGLADWAKERYGEQYLKEAAWTRFQNWLQTEIEIREISAAGIKAALKERQATVIEKVRTLTSKREWTDTIAGFAGLIVEFIRVASRRTRVVVIVDSLERLRGISGTDQDSMFQHVVTTFAGDFDRLRLPGASVVYSVPPYLSLLADVRNYVECYSLASVRVYENPFKFAARQPRKSGLDLMTRLIEQRHPTWGEVLSREALDRLALNSGGDLRHFMQRLVSAVASQAQFALDRLPLAADDPIIERILEENRGETERLTVRSEWSLLHQIAASHNAIAEDRENSLRALAHLFETRVILNYRNGAEWFDVHPLLWKLIDGYQPAAAAP
ncbi:MAG: hypothetical protein H6R10_2581 [Rhodocyclaceae bacterium]|nr:hypothetical protein [Rhodocyclaceae bacterium]